MAYIDTSVLVACYCPEPRSEAANELVREQGEPTISRLVELEFCSAVALKFRRGEFHATTAARIVALLHEHVEELAFSVVPIGHQEYEQARVWISRFSTTLRTADALHLAVAFRRHLVFTTADQGLARAAAEFGVEHKLIH